MSVTPKKIQTSCKIQNLTASPGTVEGSIADKNVWGRLTWKTTGPAESARRPLRIPTIHGPGSPRTVRKIRNLTAGPGVVTGHVTADFDANRTV